MFIRQRAFSCWWG